MSHDASRLLPLEVPPGPVGVQRVHAALRDALSGHGPAVGLIPSDAGVHAQRQRAAIAPDEPLETPVAAVLTTSGSSGDPVGVLLSGPALTAAARAAHQVLPGGPGRWLVAMPVTAVGGLMTIVRAIDADIDPVAWSGVGGAAPFTAASFVAAATDALAMSAADGAPTYVSLVPTQLARVCADAKAVDHLARFDHVLIGAAALPSSVRAAAQAAGVRLTSTYGASETCGGVVYDGIPLPGVTVSLSPDGRVRIGGTTIATGYRRRPELTADTFVDGEYLTADIGSLSEGRLTVLGRSDDIIKVGGRKVSLLAATDAARSAAGVADAVAVAVADDEWGHRPLILIVDEAPHSSRDDVILAALAAQCGPTRATVRRVDSLPYLPNGKVDRMALRDVSIDDQNPHDNQSLGTP